MSEKLLTGKEVAALFGVTERTIRNWGVPMIRLSPRFIRYDPKTVREWMAERETKRPG